MGEYRIMVVYDHCILSLITADIQWQCLLHRVSCIFQTAAYHICDHFVPERERSEDVFSLYAIRGKKKVL